jgi:hypothetical protein
MKTIGRMVTPSVLLAFCVGASTAACGQAYRRSLVTKRRMHVLSTSVLRDLRRAGTGQQCGFRPRHRKSCGIIDGSTRNQFDDLDA